MSQKIKTISILRVHGLNLFFYGDIQALKQKEKDYHHAYKHLGEEPPKCTYNLAEKCLSNINI